MPYTFGVIEDKDIEKVRRHTLKPLLALVLLIAATTINTPFAQESVNFQFMTADKKEKVLTA